MRTSGDFRVPSIRLAVSSAFRSRDGFLAGQFRRLQPDAQSADSNIPVIRAIANSKSFNLDRFASSAMPAVTEPAVTDRSNRRRGGRRTAFRNQRALWRPVRWWIAAALAGILIVGGVAGDSVPASADKAPEVNDDSLARDLARATRTPVAGFLARDHTTAAQGKLRLESRRVAWLLRNTELKTARPGIPARAETRRWWGTVVLQIAPVLRLAERLRPAVAAMAAATGLDIQLSKAERMSQKANYFIDALGYGRQGDTGVQYDPILDPNYYKRNRLQGSPKTDRGYCIMNGPLYENLLRCAPFTLFVKRYRSGGGDALRFWSQAVVFAPHELIHADGFAVADRDGRFYFAQCFIPIREPDAVRGYLGLQCLLRGLGLTQGTEFAEPSALANRIIPNRTPAGKGAPYPGAYKIVDGPWRGGPKALPMPTVYDLRLLAALY